MTLDADFIGDPREAGGETTVCCWPVEFPGGCGVEDGVEDEGERAANTLAFRMLLANSIMLRMLVLIGFAGSNRIRNIGRCWLRTLGSWWEVSD